MKDLIYKIINFFTGKWYVVQKNNYVGHIIIQLEDPTYSPETGMYIDNEEFYSKADMVPALFIAKHIASRMALDEFKEITRDCKWWNIWKADRAFKAGKVHDYSGYLYVAKYGKLPEPKQLNLENL